MAAPRKAKVSRKTSRTTASAATISKRKPKTVSGRKASVASKAKASRGPKVMKQVKKMPAALKKTPRAAKPAAPRKNKSAEAKGRDRLQELKRSLLTRREAIVREAKEEIARYMSGETRQLVDTAIDEGDWAVVDISEDINLRRLAAHRKALHDIDEALRKLREGTYGICEECGEEISEKRLDVLPTATLCISCQENKEQFEALEKEEGT